MKYTNYNEKRKGGKKENLKGKLKLLLRYH